MAKNPDWQSEKTETQGDYDLPTVSNNCPFGFKCIYGLILNDEMTCIHCKLIAPTLQEAPAASEKAKRKPVMKKETVPIKPEVDQPTLTNKNWISKKNQKKIKKEVIKEDK